MIDEPNNWPWFINLSIYLFIYLFTLFIVEKNEEAMELLINNIQL